MEEGDIEDGRQAANFKRETSCLHAVVVRDCDVSRVSESPHCVRRTGLCGPLGAAQVSWLQLLLRHRGSPQGAEEREGETRE